MILCKAKCSVYACVDPKGLQGEDQAKPDASISIYLWIDLAILSMWPSSLALPASPPSTLFAVFVLWKNKT